MSTYSRSGLARIRRVGRPFVVEVVGRDGTWKPFSEKSVFSIAEEALERAERDRRPVRLDSPLVSLLESSASIPGRPRLLAKFEGANPSGSSKDRAALSVVRAAIADGLDLRGTTIVESSSGNFALALARIARPLGASVRAIVDRRTTPDSLALLRAWGVDVEVVRVPEGEEPLRARIARAEELARSLPRAWRPNQYENPAAAAGHRATADEVLDELGRGARFSTVGTDPDVLFVPVSTGGTLVGISTRFRERGVRTRIVAIDAEGSVALPGSSPAVRIVPGLGASVPSALVGDLIERPYDDIVRVSPRESLRALYDLRDRDGLLAGGSSGAVLAGARKYLEGRLGPGRDWPEGATAVLLFADRGDRYASTLFDPEWVARNVP